MQFDFHISTDDTSVRVFGELEAQAGAAKWDFKIPMEPEAIGEVIEQLSEISKAIQKKVAERKPEV